jgi:hypothetical protein
MRKNEDAAFTDAMQFIFKWEGEYVNDPKDLGGETKYGISKRWYPHLDIKNLTRDQASKIYYKDYWKKAGCDKHFFPDNILLFDTAVHMGVFRALEIYQNCRDWKDFLLRRISLYTDMPTAGTYLRGWINRVIDLWRYIKNKGGK